MRVGPTEKESFVDEDTEQNFKTSNRGGGKGGKQTGRAGRR